MPRSRVLVAPLLLVAAMGTPRPARADREVGLGLAYDPRLPVGGLRDLVTSAGLGGVQGRWDYYATDAFVVGFEAQYHLFERGPDVRTVAIPDGAATAPFTSYAYFFTVLPTVRYFPWPQASVRPYAALGAGATAATAAVVASDLSRRTDGWGLVLQPSVGVLWRLTHEDELAGGEGWHVTRTRESMFALAASVAGSFTTADLLFANDVAYVGVQLGVYSKL